MPPHYESVTGRGVGSAMRANTAETQEDTL